MFCCAVLPKPRTSIIAPNPKALWNLRLPCKPGLQLPVPWTRCHVSVIHEVANAASYLEPPRYTPSETKYGINNIPRVRQLCSRQSMGKDAIRRPPGRNAAKVSRPSKDPKNGRREIAGGLGANGVSRGSSGGRPAHPDLAPHMSVR